MNNKKQYERRILSEFTSCCVEFQNGEILPGDNQERPDAIWTNRSITIGLEHTDLCRQTQAQQEGEAESILEEATTLWAKRSDTIINARVSFSDVPPKKNRHKTAQAIVDYILHHLTKEPLQQFRSYEDDVDADSTVIDFISFFTDPSLTESFFGLSGGSWLPQITTKDIQDRIDEKESRIALDDRWPEYTHLVITTDTKVLSTTWGHTVTNNLGPVTTRFQKVWLFNALAKTLVGIEKEASNQRLEATRINSWEL